MDEPDEVPIFGGVFKVDPMPDPKKFIPQYQPNMPEYEPTAN